MSDHSQFTGYKVQLELRDGKLIEGTIVKATDKGLTLSDVTFGDGGTSQAFKVRSSRLRDLKVLGVPSRVQQQGQRRGNGRAENQNQNQNQGQGQRQGRRQGNSSRESTASLGDWQDDDVKQIKNSADFDFQQSLSRFNKKDVFEQLKQQDEIDPGQRLVAVNKRGGEKGGASSGHKVNYEYDEMVIPNAKQDVWDKVNAEYDAAAPSTAKSNHNDNDDEVEDFESATDDEDEDEVDESTRSNSSGRPTTKSSSAEANGLDEDDTEDDDDEYEDARDDEKYFPITNAINITHLLHSAVDKDGSSTAAGTDKAQILSQLEQMLIGNANASSTSRNGSLSLGGPSGTNTTAQLPVLTNVKTKQTVPTASPIELLEIERITNESVAVSTETMNEVFGLNASYLVKSHLGGAARLTVRNSNPEPLIVILVSEINRAGTKAVALARYLTQLKQVRVVIMFSCPLNDIQDCYVLNRLEVFKSSGGKIVNSLKNLNALLAKLNSPVELIIDAMQGFDSNLSDFAMSRSAHQKTTEIVNWCNDTRAKSKGVKVWSLDLPSGYDSSSGLQNFDVALARTDKVLCAHAWPLTCLRAMGHMLGAPGTAGKATTPDDCPVVLVDCGIPTSVYAQKNSLRKFNNVDTFVASGTLGLTL